MISTRPGHDEPDHAPAANLRSSRTIRNANLLVLLWLVFYGSFTLFAPPLLDDADSVHAEVAREMLLRHDFVTLYANGIRYLEKAPLYYWSMAASMRVFGVSTAAARLPLQLCVLLLSLLLESWARRSFRSARAGLYAGLITLSSFGIFIFSRINIPDVLVCVLLSVSLYAFAQTEEQAEPERRWCLLFAAAIALDLLTKGLIGIVFPLLIVASYLLLTRGVRGAFGRVRKLHPWTSFALLLVIAVPWHVLIALANPSHGDPGGLVKIDGHWQAALPTDGNVHGWLWFYFINEQIYRYLNLRVPHDYDTSPLWLFLGLIMVWLMPWSAFLPTAFLRAARSLRRDRQRTPSEGTAAADVLDASRADIASPTLLAHLRTLAAPARTNLLLLLWTVIPLLFFTFSTRQEYYVLPSLPPMILLLAALLAEGSHPVLASFAARPLRRVALLLLIVGAAIAAGLVLFLLRTQAPAPDTDLATLLQSNPADYALSFGHFLDLNARALGLFRVPLLLTAIAVLGGTLAHWLLRRAARPHAATLALAAASFLFLLAAHRGLVIFSPTLTSYQLADTIRPRLQPNDLIAIHGEYEAGSTLGFYLRRNNLHIIEGRSSNLWYGSFFPDAPPIFETRESIAAKWQGPQRIFLWEDPHDPERKPLQLPAPVYVIATSGGKQILSNQK